MGPSTVAPGARVVWEAIWSPDDVAYVKRVSLPSDAMILMSFRSGVPDEFGVYS